MPIQKMIHEDNEITYWAFGIVLQDEINFDGNFFGNAQTMRVDKKGKIWTLWQNIRQRRAYDLMVDKDMHIDEYKPDIRPSNDNEIASHASELAKELLDILRTRIDTMKDEKATLERIAQAISS